MVLRNTMGINYNTLATLAGSKPWRLFFAFLIFHFEFERAFVGPFPDSAVYPIVYKRKKERRQNKGRLPYSAIGKRVIEKTNGKSEAYLSERNDVFMTCIRKTALSDARASLKKYRTLIGMHLIGIMIAMPGLHRLFPREV